MCPSNFIPIWSSLDKNTCLRTLLALKNVSTDCVFHQVSRQLRTKVIEQYVFITRPTNQTARLTCSGKPKTTNRRTMRVRTTCTLEDPSFTVLGSTSHRINIFRGQKQIEEINIEHYNKTKWTVIRPLAKSNLDEILSTPLVKLIVPTSALVAIVVCIGMSICIYRLYHSHLSGQSSITVAQPPLHIAA